MTSLRARPMRGLTANPQNLKGARGKDGALDRLRHSVQREETALIEGLVAAAAGTDLSAPMPGESGRQTTFSP